MRVMPADLHLLLMLLGLQNTSYLEAAAYTLQMSQWVTAAQPIAEGRLRHDCSTRHEHQQQQHDKGDLIVHYHDAKSFRRIASSLNPMMPDFKVWPVNRRVTPSTHQPLTLNTVPKSTTRGRQGG